MSPHCIPTNLPTYFYYLTISRFPQHYRCDSFFYKGWFFINIIFDIKELLVPEVEKIANLCTLHPPQRPYESRHWPLRDLTFRALVCSTFANATRNNDLQNRKFDLEKLNGVVIFFCKEFYNSQIKFSSPNNIVGFNQEIFFQRLCRKIGTCTNYIKADDYWSFF